MKDLSYFEMRAHLYEKEQHNTVETKFQDLESIWFCTRKNVKRKLKNFEEQGKLSYSPGVGRGNPSKITFHSSFQREVERFVLDCIKKDKLDDIVQLLQFDIPKSWVASISPQLQKMFGMQGAKGDKDILRTIISRNLSTLDPVFSSITVENHMIEQLGDTLVTYNHEQDEIIPHLAHHWQVSDNGKKWSFYLRKGVRFHHQGLFTSADVKYTLERFKQGTPFFWLVRDIVAIECPGPYVIHIHLQKSNPFFLRYLSAANLSMLPKDIPFEENQWIGTGPFRLKERSKKRIILEAFDQYFLERPFLDRIEFWKIPMDTVKTVTYNISSKEEMEDGIQKREMEIGFRFLMFNFTKPSAVQSHHFRTALFHLLDTHKMHADLGLEEPVEATSFFPWKSRKRSRDRSLVPGLLQLSGYQGEPLQLYCLDYPKAIDEAVWFQQQASQYGIHLDLTSFDFDDFYSFSFDDKADMIFMGEVSTSDYHLSFLGAFYNEVLLFRRFMSEQQLIQIDERLEEFKQATTNEGREKIIDVIEDYLKDNHLLLFQHHPVKNRIFHPMIQDIQFKSFGQVDFRKLWIK
ncbi:SgrR family transcriptional regulator [Sediminibacillus albus]|uniref:DNA-binding transcriptional regulator SgrR of sgrS sRNA, contains a MarR-type HTH domain and a solute-binding domain n=1 Tax=Sediminibacillus albus TaxID=407036 RepID=A0A1G9C9G6_9BACI|nr:ABC transporter substrate-binding protein [Sediminibacillus albus]SDK48291.1 DNA-binding transcriptional regulator SgrR of sgrS sRNA, contains a MarR-type HTH domain and a solute-binding domain [Sediminibacillus albus]